MHILITSILIWTNFSYIHFVSCSCKVVRAPVYMNDNWDNSPNQFHAWNHKHHLNEFKAGNTHIHKVSHRFSSALRCSIAWDISRECMYTFNLFCKCIYLYRIKLSLFCSFFFLPIECATKIICVKIAFTSIKWEKNYGKGKLRNQHRIHAIQFYADFSVSGNAVNGLEQGA